MTASTETTISPLAVSSFNQKIASRTARVGIVGLGYVGLPLSLMYSAERFPVTGFDVDEAKVKMLNAGQSYIAQIESKNIAAARAQGFQATASFAEIAHMDAIIICVPTPLNEYHEPDLSYIVNTAKSIAPHLRAGQLVVLESTTYPGTTREVLIPILEKENRANLKAAAKDGAGEDVFFVAFSPEREDPGRKDIERRDIPKVVGGAEPTAAELAAGLYGSIFNRTVRVSSPDVAEMAKLLENIYRCVNIALINELKILCLRMNIDIFEVIEAAATKPFGFQPFYPGPGLGGHCIPIDPFYLSWKAREFDFHTRFIELAGEVNIQMPYHVVSSVAEALNQHKKSINGSRILLLGMAYKKDIDDLRESPSLTIYELLQKAGAEVEYNDPHVPFVGRGRKYELHKSSVPLDNLGDYDCVLVVTDHTAYDWQSIVKESKLVVDSRNATAGIRSDKIVHC